MKVYITKVSKYKKKGNNGMYGLFGEFLRVLPLKFHFRMIFQTYPASLGQFGACDDFFQLALLLL